MGRQVNHRTYIRISGTSSPCSYYEKREKVPVDNAVLEYFLFCGRVEGGGGQFGQCLKVYNIFFFEGFPNGVLVLYQATNSAHACYFLSLDVANGQARYCLMI